MWLLSLASWGYVALLDRLAETACSSIYLAEYFVRAVAARFLAVSREKQLKEHRTSVYKVTLRNKLLATARS